MSSRSHQIIRLVSSYPPSSIMHTDLVGNNGCASSCETSQHFTDRGLTNELSLQTVESQPQGIASGTPATSLVASLVLKLYNFSILHLMFFIRLKPSVITCCKKSVINRFSSFPTGYLLGAEFCRFSRK